MLGLIKVVNRYKFLVILVTGLFIIGGWLFSRFMTPLYQASTVLMVTNSEDSKVDYMEIMANKQMVKTYSQLVTSRAVMEQVVQALDFTVTVGTLRQAVYVRQLGDTEIMEIRVTYPDPKQAVTIANKTAEVFILNLHKTLGLNNVRLIDMAVENSAPVKPDVRLNTILAGLSGFILIITGCLFMDYVRKPNCQQENDKGNMTGYGNS